MTLFLTIFLKVGMEISWLSSFLGSYDKFYRDIDHRILALCFYTISRCLPTTVSCLTIKNYTFIKVQIFFISFCTCASFYNCFEFSNSASSKYTHEFLNQARRCWCPKNTPNYTKIVQCPSDLSPFILLIW